MFLPTGHVKFVNWSALHNIRGAGRKRSRKISTLSCHVLSCQKVGCLVEEIYLSYSEENNQVSYNSDPNPGPRYGGKPSECIGKYRWIWGTVHNIALDSRALCNRKCIGGRRLAGLQWTPMTANALVLQFNLYRSMSSSPTSFFSCFFNIVNDKGSFTEHHKGWNFVEVQVHPHFLGRCQIFESTLLPVFMSRITFVGILSLW